MATTTSHSSGNVKTAPEVIPPLEHGDHVTREEFRRRLQVTPHATRAERIGGVVFLDAAHRPQRSLRSVAPATPSLGNGDRLSRPEFRRRWEGMPHLKKAERIGGAVHMQAAVRFRQHGNPHARLVTWLGNYEAGTPGIAVADNTTIELGPEDDAQSDAALLILPESGGHCRINEDGYLDGAPELIAEVAACSASYDLHDKRDLYRTSGVQEYLVWMTLEQRLLWYRLIDGAYVELAADADGVVRSEVFPGLALDRQALLTGDMRRVLDVLQAEMTTGAHSDFCRQLDERSTRSSDG
ncbi:MAG: Uma2 family endonuclease [Maioricimonas sp. JB049]